MWVELIVLIVGIVLMNITICDANGTMSISTSFLTKATIEESTRMEAEDEIVPVPRPPCAETDDGRDYKSAGMITSGANVPDKRYYIDGASNSKIYFYTGMPFAKSTDAINYLKRKLNEVG